MLAEWDGIDKLPGGAMARLINGESLGLPEGSMSS